MKEDKAQALADRLGVEIEADDNFLKDGPEEIKIANEKILLYWRPKWLFNAVENYRGRRTIEALKIMEEADVADDSPALFSIIQSVRAELEKTITAAEGARRGVRRGGPCIVIGTGCSVDGRYEEIKASGLPVIACNSILHALLANGITPAACVVYDASPNLATHFYGVDTPGLDYYVSTSCHPETIEAIRRTGGRIHAYVMDGSDRIFGVYLPALYPKTNFHAINTCGCVANMAMQVSFQLFGHAPIALFGVDYCFLDGKFRARDYRMLNGAWEEIEINHELVDKKEKIDNGAGVDCWSDHRLYAHTLDDFLRLLKMPVINCGDPRAIPTAPFMDFKRFVERYGNESKNIS